MSKNILIKGGRLLDINNGYHFDNKDILIEDGIIKQIKNEIKEIDNCNVLKLSGEVVSPGFIDIHSHVFYGETSLGIEPDIVGVNIGTTTLFDAGSSGAKNYEKFFQNVIKKSVTRVYCLINIAYTGLEKPRYEIADLNNINIDSLKTVVEKNRNYIKGIKARASASTVGELGIIPIKIAKRTAAELGLPLVVHIGNYPPKIEEVLSVMDKGDIITHCFHGKPNGIMDENGLIRKEVRDAKERGVLFDVGHGTSSFNSNIARKAMKQGFLPDIISTDIYRDNYKGPVYSLITTVNKLIALGMSIEECVSRVTTSPAKTFNLDGLGVIREGAKGDLTIFDIIEEPIELKDSDGNIFSGEEYIKAKYAVIDGLVISIK